jgi:hypothetical protein
VESVFVKRILKHSPTFKNILKNPQFSRNWAIGPMVWGLFLYDSRYRSKSSRWILKMTVLRQITCDKIGTTNSYNRILQQLRHSTTAYNIVQHCTEYNITITLYNQHSLFYNKYLRKEYEPEPAPKPVRLTLDSTVCRRGELNCHCRNKSVPFRRLGVSRRSFSVCSS